MLFNSLLGSDTRKSYVVFSRLFVAQHRRQIFTELLALSYGETHATFTESLMNHLEKIDRRRNRVVHWIAMTSSTAGAPDRIALHQHPNMFAGGRMTEDELTDFSKRAEFLAMLVYNFDHFIKFGAAQPGLPLDIPGRTPWRDIFQQPIEYPPHMDHPLRSFYQYDPPAKPSGE
jgi:hypothetical protein